MSENTQLPDEPTAAVRKLIIVEHDAESTVLKGDHPAPDSAAEPADQPEVIRKPIVIGVDPETEEDDGTRSPKNTNVTGIDRV